MTWPEHIQFARELRKNQTPQEKLLWGVLRNRRLSGFKFLRQHPFRIPGVSKNFYFADFYCAEKHLVIEIDSNIHESQAQYDQSRDRDLAELGLTVLRIKNDEVEKNIELVTKKIKEFCDSPPTPSLHVE